MPITIRVPRLLNTTNDRGPDLFRPESRPSREAAALECLDVGILFVTERGRVTGANSAGVRILERSDAVSVNGDGVLVAIDARERRALEVLIAKACAIPDDGAMPPSGATLLRASENGTSLEVVVTPLGSEFDEVTGNSCAVLLLRESASSVVSVARLQDLFNLTLTEGRVARLLARGTSVAEIGAEMSVSVATVRTHVRHLLAKVDARSISDLTRRLASLLPVR